MDAFECFCFAVLPHHELIRVGLQQAIDQSQAA
jgi:hypothetical protein